ncbi:hypothetical protein [Actinomadura napierensis]|uniref:Uncharacterized protein n=1 Tax=Actinomadura napierensis TaxID=267854 RepID=A0ABN3A1V1_9ACTN
MSHWSQRTQMRLWIVAVAITAEPTVRGVVISLLGVKRGAQGYLSVIASDACQGWSHQSELWSVPGYWLLHGLPILVVLPAFLLWLMVRRRFVGWATAAVLAFVTLAEPALYGYDVARWGEQCVGLWLPMGGWGAVRWAYGAVPLVLILVSTYRPGPRMPRLVCGTLVAGLVLCAAADQETPPRYAASGADCRHAERADMSGKVPFTQVMAKLSQREREIAFLCSVRGYTLGYGGGSPHGDLLTDSEQIEIGRRACRGESLWSAGMPRGIIPPAIQQMAYLCPETADERRVAQERSTAALHAQYKQNVAKALATCRRGIPAGFHPVRQATRVIDGGESSSYLVGDEGSSGKSLGAAVHDGLVASGDGEATVITGTESRLCVTVRAYKKAPPLALKGWERVAEVGFDSAKGHALLTAMDGPLPFPAVTVAGPGHYRLRVYVRGRRAPETLMDEPPNERHLLVVFPGKGMKPKTYKNTER